MTLNELFKEFENKTDIQREEHRKKFYAIETEIEVSGVIKDINKYRIVITDFSPSLLGRQEVNINHAGGAINTRQLLECFPGDSVRLTTLTQKGELSCWRSA